MSPGGRGQRGAVPRRQPTAVAFPGGRSAPHEKRPMCGGDRAGGAAPGGYRSPAQQPSSWEGRAGVRRALRGPDGAVMAGSGPGRTGETRRGWGGANRGRGPGAVKPPREHLGPGAAPGTAPQLPRPGPAPHPGEKNKNPPFSFLFSNFYLSNFYSPRRPLQGRGNRAREMLRSPAPAHSPVGHPRYVSSAVSLRNPSLGGPGGSWGSARVCREVTPPHAPTPPGAAAPAGRQRAKEREIPSLPTAPDRAPGREEQMRFYLLKNKKQF